MSPKTIHFESTSSLSISSAIKNKTSTVCLYVFSVIESHKNYWSTKLAGLYPAGSSIFYAVLRWWSFVLLYILTTKSESVSIFIFSLSYVTQRLGFFTLLMLLRRWSLNSEFMAFTNNIITPRSCIRKWKRYKERWWKTSLDNNTFLLNKELFYSFVGPSTN